MKHPRIRNIKIQGFRSFGSESQEADLNAPIAVFWGPNSKGKSSFAEAIEFLLTGKIVRREILSSRQDEFADALRHAHLNSHRESFVEATIKPADDGPVCKIKRVLDKDYSKLGECKTTLFVDGKAVSEDALSDIGFVLFQPPLSAPVLSQHTLTYLFTVKPSDRSYYFKALLEVTDIDEFREAVSNLEPKLKEEDEEVLDRFGKILEILQINKDIGHAEFTNGEKLEEVFAAGGASLLSKNDYPIRNGLAERLSDVEQLLLEKRSKTFPINLFTHTAFANPSAIDEKDWTKLRHFIEEKEKVDEKTREIMALFQKVLEISSLTQSDVDQDCPVCGTENALTQDRIKVIRGQVEATEAYQKAKRNALAALGNLKARAAEYKERSRTSLPEMVRVIVHKRREAGFTVKRLTTVLGDNGEGLVLPWNKNLKRLCRKSQTVRLKARALEETLETLIQKPNTLEEVQSLIDALNELHKGGLDLLAAESEYRSTTQSLYAAVKAVVDKNSQTEGWEEFIDLGKNLSRLRDVMVEKASIAIVAEELKAASREIEKGVEVVLDQKFSDLTSSINDWWGRLRGGEYTMFSAVARRGKNTIDFKGGLATPGNEKDPKIRDVIAVFSDSQLHCLGLAVFLARAEHYRTSFVVLDDPVLSSDEDYRIHFRSRVIERLHDLGIQVIIVTQDRATWRDIATVNEYLGVDQFQIELNNPLEGSIIKKTGDELSAMLASAEAYTTSDALEIRKAGGEKLRDATERFCKLLLVKKRVADGDASAALSDYDNQRLSGDDNLVKKVIPHLTLDNSHPGKLRTIQNDLNLAKHDDDNIPSRVALKEALGNLRKFQKDYL